MPTIQRRLLLVFFFIFLLNQLAIGYRSLEENADDMDLNTNIHSSKLRSVLWPKICFTTLMKKSDYIGKESDRNSQYRLSRSARKCYPLDKLWKKRTSHLSFSSFWLKPKRNRIRFLRCLFWGGGDSFSWQICLFISRRSHQCQDSCPRRGFRLIYVMTMQSERSID